MGNILANITNRSASRTYSSSEGERGECSRKLSKTNEQNLDGLLLSCPTSTPNNSDAFVSPNSSTKGSVPLHPFVSSLHATDVSADNIVAATKRVHTISLSDNTNESLSRLTCRSEDIGKPRENNVADVAKYGVDEYFETEQSRTEEVGQRRPSPTDDLGGHGPHGFHNSSCTTGPALMVQLGASCSLLTHEHTDQETVEETKQVVTVSSDNIAKRDELDVGEGREDHVAAEVAATKKVKNELKKKERRITHYSSAHKILLVGEGDFSFSACLARTFRSATNMIATTWESEETLFREHWSAEDHIEELERLGGLVLYEVDVHDMHTHPILMRMNKFDQIVFNFPHAGHYSYLCERDSSLIEMHKELLTGFFKSSSKMLSEDGEVHVAHRDDEPYNTWEIVKLAKRAGLGLKEKVAFRKSDYPGYHNKRGGGIHSNKTFPLLLETALPSNSSQ